MEFLPKIAGAVVLWLVILFFGLLPLRIKQFKSNRTLLSLSNCFSGGLFLAIGLIHILPEAHSKLEGKYEAQYAKENKEVYPVSYLISLATFSVVLLIHKVVSSSINTQTNRTSATSYNHEEMPIELLRNNLITYHNGQDQAIELISKKQSVDQPDGNKTRELENPILGDLGHDNQPQLLETKNLLEEGGGQFENRRRGDIGHAFVYPVHHDHHIVLTDGSFRAYVLLVAMSIHSIFAGIAFGISDSGRETFDMFIAMISHKWSEALTVGVSLITSRISSNRSFYMILFFSFITPFGILIGCLLSGMSDTVVGVALAISSGTFIYISCAEIIIEEFSNNQQVFMKFLAYTLGIVFVSLMLLIE